MLNKYYQKNRGTLISLKRHLQRPNICLNIPTLFCGIYYLLWTYSQLYVLKDLLEDWRTLNSNVMLLIQLLMKIYWWYSCYCFILVIIIFIISVLLLTVVYLFKTNITIDLVYEKRLRTSYSLQNRKGYVHFLHKVYSSN